MSEGHYVDVLGGAVLAAIDTLQELCREAPSTALRVEAAIAILTFNASMRPPLREDYDE